MGPWSGSPAVTVWREAHHDDASDVETADAIVVLGAAQYDGTPSPVFKGRLDHALLMYQEGRAEHVLVLGSNQPGDRTTEAASGRDYLISRGIPASAVVSVPVGHTSWESLRAAAKAMDGSGMHSAFLARNPWHNARITHGGRPGAARIRLGHLDIRVRHEADADDRLRAGDVRVPVLPGVRGTVTPATSP